MLLWRWMNGHSLHSNSREIIVDDEGVNRKRVEGLARLELLYIWCWICAL